MNVNTRSIIKAERKTVVAAKVRKENCPKFAYCVNLSQMCILLNEWVAKMYYFGM